MEGQSRFLGARTGNRTRPEQRRKATYEHEQPGQREPHAFVIQPSLFAHAPRRARCAQMGARGMWWVTDLLLASGHDPPVGLLSRVEDRAEMHASVLLSSAVDK